jgi:nucleoside 2-deoxyribosyltransferase
LPVALLKAVVARDPALRWLPDDRTRGRAMSRTTLQPRVYLAGPGVFRQDPNSYGRMLQDKCAQAGLAGCWPLDGAVAPGPPLETARAIYRANLALIDAAAAIIADLSPFRGPNMDPGTAWEIGYGVARGLPVFAWTDDPEVLLGRTRRQLGMHAQDEGPVDPQGFAIEDFGLVENLMVAVSCASIHRNPDAAIAACAAALSGNRPA